MPFQSWCCAVIRTPRFIAIFENPMIPTRSREWESFQVSSKLSYSTAVDRSRCFDVYERLEFTESFPSQSIHGCGYAAAKSISRRRRNHRYERHNSISGNRKEEQQPLPIFNIRAKVCAIEFYLQWRADIVNSKHLCYWRKTELRTSLALLSRSWLERDTHTWLDNWCWQRVIR